MDLRSVSTENILSEVGRRLFQSALLKVGDLTIFLEIRGGNPCLISKAPSGYEQIEIRFVPSHSKDGKPRALFMKNQLTLMEWVDLNDTRKD